MITPHGLPLPTTKYVFMGEDNENHLSGETYTVIETGNHWMRNVGYVIWVATEEAKYSIDTDYALACDVDYFKKNFRAY